MIYGTAAASLHAYNVSCEPDISHTAGSGRAVKVCVHLHYMHVSVHVCNSKLEHGVVSHPRTGMCPRLLPSPSAW